MSGQSKPPTLPSARETAQARLLRAVTAQKNQVCDSPTALLRAARAANQNKAGGSLHALIRTQAVSRPSASLQQLPTRLSLCGAVSAGLIIWAVGGEFYQVIVAGAVAGAIAFCTVQHGRRRQALGQLAEQLDLAADFDEHHREWVGLLPPEALPPLADVRRELGLLLPLLPRAKAEGALTREEVFFIRQAVTRYLPDAVQKWCDIPSSSREFDNPARLASAQFVTEQITAIAEKLTEIEQRLIQGQMRRLEEHGKFIARKTAK